MKCAENIANIYMTELERNRSERNFLSLTPRKGKTVEKIADLSIIEGTKAQEVLETWNEFHRNAKHKTYADLYSKVFYCQNFADISAGPHALLELIADREFLFFEYGESYTPPGYPPLSHLVKSPDAEAHNYPEEKRNKVLEQAFVPTQAHRQDYLKWQKNLQNLEEAYIQRIRHLALLPEIPNSFSVEVHTCPEEDVTDIEKCLDALFDAYLQVFQESGNKLYNSPAEDTHMVLNVIHSVMEYLSNHPNEIPGTSAIVFDEAKIV